MIAYDNCALFVGVADYSAFDVSIGDAPGASDLSGALADALAFYRICRELEIPAENMRILTSPRLDAKKEGIPAACLGDATRASILDGLAWLAGRLSAEGRPPGLFTYSGHGDTLEGQGLVICPSDTAGPNLKGSILYTQIQAIFAEQDAAANLTVILDTCHAGAARAGRGRRSGSLSRRALKGRPGGAPVLGSRMIAACEPTDLAWRGQFSGVGRGALSWAVAATLEQWSPRAVGRHVELDLSYGELVERAQGLLATLSFEQTPVLSGRPGTARAPFFHAGVGPGKQGTSDAPTAPRDAGQIIPDVKIRLTASWYEGAWSIVSVGEEPPKGSGYNRQTEYWALDANFGTSHREGDQLTFALDAPGSSGQPAVFTNPTDSLWTPMDSTPPVAFFGMDATGTFPIGVVFDQGAAGGWTGDVTWYAAAKEGSTGPSGYIINPPPKSQQILTYGAPPALSAGDSWFMMKLPALIWGSSPTQLEPVASYGVGMTTTAGGTLYLASHYLASDGKHYIHIFTSPDGVSFGDPQSGPGYDNDPDHGPASYGAPALAALGDDIYLMYYSASKAMRWSILVSGEGWDPRSVAKVTYCDSAGDRVGLYAGGPPALAVYPGSSDGLLLCLACQKKSNSKDILTAVLKNGEDLWSDVSSGVGIQDAAGAPALATLDAGSGPTLFLAYPSTEGDIQVFKATTVTATKIAWDTEAIATLPRPSDSLSWMSASLSVWQGQLVMTCRSSDGHVWACFSPDGVTWSGYQDLASQVPDVATAIAPAVSAIGSTLVIGFAASSYGTPHALATTSQPVEG